MTSLLFSTSDYDYLKDEMRAHGEFESAEVERDHFPDGERYLRVLTNVEGRDVVLLGGTISDGATMELYDLACAITKAGAARLTIVIPYFGYSTMERAAKHGEVVTAKTRARLLSSIPSAMNGNRIILLDLHAEGIPYYFEAGVTTKHVYGKAAIFDALRTAMGTDFVLGSTDAGRAKWVESLANEMSVPASHVLKRRLSGEETELLAINAHVEGKHVAMYDDMIRTGSTLITASKAYLDAGAISVSAFATHGVFPGEALQKLRNSGHIKQIVVTDSHPRAVELADDFLKVVSVGKILVAGLKAGW